MGGDWKSMVVQKTWNVERHVRPLQHEGSWICLIKHSDKWERGQVHMLDNINCGSIRS